MTSKYGVIIAINLTERQNLFISAEQIASSDNMSSATTSRMDIYSFSEKFMDYNPNRIKEDLGLVLKHTGNMGTVDSIISLTRKTFVGEKAHDSSVDVFDAAVKISLRTVKGSQDEVGNTTVREFMEVAESVNDINSRIKVVCGTAESVGQLTRNLEPSDTEDTIANSALYLATKLLSRYVETASGDEAAEVFGNLLPSAARVLEKPSSIIGILAILTSDSQLRNLLREE